MSEAKTPANEVKKATKTRSPSYPQASLPDAINRAKAIWDAQRWHTAPVKAIIEHMNYTSINGSSLGMLSTLKAYGLLEQVSGSKENATLKLTDDAVTLCEAPKGTPKYDDAVSRTAFKPVIFAELREEFGDFLPSEATLRYFLINRKFNPSVVSDVMRVYKDTIEFVGGTDSSYNDEERKEDATNMQTPPLSSNQVTNPNQSNYPRGSSPPFSVPSQEPPTPAEHKQVRHLRFPITETSEVKIELIGEVTPEAIDAVKIMLDAQKMILESQVKAKAVSASTSPQSPLARTGSAIWHQGEADQPVTVTGVAGEQDGKRYLKIEGSDTGVPENEIEFTS